MTAITDDRAILQDARIAGQAPVERAGHRILVRFGAGHVIVRSRLVPAPWLGARQSAWGPVMQLIVHDTQERQDWRPGVSTRMRVSALTGAEALSIFEQWCAPGLGAPIHWHPVEEVLTILSGEAELWLEGETVRAGAGRSVVIPPLRRHGFRNAGLGELHMLATLASPVFEAHFEDDGSVIRRWMLPGTAEG